MDADNDDRIVHPSDLPKYGFSFSNPHRLRLEKAGLFPRRVYLTPGDKHAGRRAFGYSHRELIAHSVALLKARDMDSAA